MEKRSAFADALSAILVKYKYILAQEAEALKKSFHESDSQQFDYFLLSEGLVEKEALLKCLSEYYAVPACDVVGYFFDHFLVVDFPKDFLLRHSIIPMEIDNDMLVVVAANPALEGLAAAIEKFTSNDLVFMVGLGPDICDAVEEFYDLAVTEDIPEDIDINEEHRVQESEKELEEYNMSIISREEE